MLLFAAFLIPIYKSTAFRRRKNNAGDLDRSSLALNVGKRNQKTPQTGRESGFPSERLHRDFTCHLPPGALGFTNPTMGFRNSSSQCRTSGTTREMMVQSRQTKNLQNQSPTTSRWKTRSLPWKLLLKLHIVIIMSYITYTAILHTSLTSSPKLQKKALSLDSDTAINESPAMAVEATSTASITSIPTPLNTFQLAVPVLGPDGKIQDVFSNSTFRNPNTAATGEVGGNPCQVVLMQYIFNSSFGMPFLGTYSPPLLFSTFINRILILIFVQGIMYRQLVWRVLML